MSSYAGPVSIPVLNQVFSYTLCRTPLKPTLHGWGGEINTEVLVERTQGMTDEPEVVDLPDVEATRESTMLTDFS